MNLKDIVGTEYSEITNKKTKNIQTVNEEHFLLTFFLEKCNSQTENTYHFDENKYDFLKKAIQNTFIKSDVKNSTIGYIRDDILLFSLLLSKIERDINLNLSHAGLFLSALINSHYKKTKDAKPYTIVTENLQTKIDYLCFKNVGASVEINGSTGSALGYEMSSGNILVKGNCENMAGNGINGGNIRVEHAGMYLGCSMNDGKIYAKSAKGGLGMNMNGGEIHISEKYDERIGAFGGKVYFRDEQIFPMKKKKK